MAVNMQTDSWLVVAPTTAGALLLLAGFWKLVSFWERMWIESLSSRNVDRRIMRWQRTLFRGKLVFGRWGGPGKVEYVRVATLVSRGVILLIAAVLILAVGKRLLSEAL